MIGIQLVGPASGKREVAAPTRPTELRGSLLAIRALARVDAVLGGWAPVGSGCHYCDNPRLYGAVPSGGCPCKATRSPGIRRASATDDDYFETRRRLLSEREAALRYGLSYHPGGAVLSVR